MHIIYVAKNLRLIATEAEDLRVKLSGIRESLLFRVRERSAFQQKRQEIANEIERLNGEITTIEQQNVGLKERREIYERERNILNQDYEPLRLLFREVDVMRYLIVEDEDQLRDKLVIGFSNTQDVGKLIAYIKTKKTYDRLTVMINSKNKELDENESTLSRLIKGCEDLRIQSQKLREKVPEFQQLEAELAKLDGMVQPVLIH